MDPAMYIDRFIGWQAAVEARLLASGLFSLEELDNHESHCRPDPSFIWQDETTRVAHWAEWWHDAGEKYELPPDFVDWDAIDARLDSQPRETRARPTMKQWATDKVTKTFFRVRTQRDLDNAFALLSHTEERHHIAQAIIQMAVDRVVRLERKAYQAQVDEFRELNTKFLEAATKCGWRLLPDAIPTAETLAPGSIRKQAWCAYRPENWPSESWKVGRGKELRPGATVAALSEQELFGILLGL